MSKYKLYLSSGEELLRGLKQEYQSLEAEKMEEDNDTEVMEKSNCATGCCTISMVQINTIHDFAGKDCTNGISTVKILSRYP